MLKLLSALIALVITFPAAANETETPIITFHTTLYENAGDDNAFHFYIGTKTDTYIYVDFGFGKTKVEVAPAVFDSSTSAIKATTVPGSVSEAGIVKIYGDASQIDYLDLEGVYITDLDIEQLTNLEILNVKHNELSALDLTMMDKLQALYLSDNPFGTTPLIIGGNKPELTILEMSNCGAINQDFNLSDYPAMVAFDAYATKGLMTIDPTNCPDLMKLSIDCTGVTSLDVTKNPKLLILNVSETGIKDLDLNNNIYLTELYCTHSGRMMSEYKYDTLDVTMLPNLKRLFCSDNNLTTLDVSKNPLLTDLYCNTNKLTSLDISNNPDILNLGIYNNYMDFTTMPLPRPTFIEYVYNQRPLPVSRSYPVGAEIDFSSQVILPDSETWFALFANRKDSDGSNIKEELPADYYTFKNGKVTLLKASTDSLTMAFANSLFPEYDLQTTNFMVKPANDYGNDNKIISINVLPTTKDMALAIGISNASPENPKTFSVDFGNGVTKKFTTTTSGIPSEPNASGPIVNASQPTIVYIPEGDDLTALGIENIGLANINLSLAPTLADLKLVNCHLNAIDLTNNTMVRSIDLSNNNIEILNLYGQNEMMNKRLLKDLNVSYNKLTYLIPGLGKIANVNLSHNQLEDINLLKASETVTLNLSNNKLTEVALQDLESLKYLDLSNNELSDIIIADYLDFDYLNLSGNSFPLSTLPVNAAQEYVYAPQKQWPMPEKAPSANLTSQLLDDATVFTWYKADGTAITGNSIKEVYPGAFQLLDTNLGKIYCSFTNPAFPAFSGDNAYRTTEVEVAPVPENVVCTLHTLANGIGELGLRAKTDNTSIYIDWEGNGFLDEFRTGKNLTIYYVNVHPDVDVKMYSYSADCDLDVISIDAGPLQAIDATPLTQLITFSVYGSGLTPDKISMPSSASLEELSIVGGQINNMDFIKGKFPGLRMMNLSNNQLTECDFSKWNKLEAIYASGNKLTSATFNNPKVWDLALAQNELSEIDLSGLPLLSQLRIFENNFHTLDISANPELRVLDISSNNFYFNTLPENRPSFYHYIYRNQKSVEAELVNGYIIDLSGFGAQTFRWFIDSPYIDENGELNGEELIEGVDYLIENGVTTFRKNVNNVMCVMQNDMFPELYLHTDFMDITGTTGIEDINSENNGETNIYDMQGRRVKHPVRGIYIINGKKTYLR